MQRHVRMTTVAVTLAVTAVLSMMVPAGAARSAVPGFDGSTITVGGLGQLSQLANAPLGTKARIARFNADNEIKGVKIKLAEFADDGGDPATALSVTRRLVTEDGVFALVGEESIATPVQYLEQQHIPFFGGGFNTGYCSTKPVTSQWGFAPTGCVVPTNPSFVNDYNANFYKYASQVTGKKHPTLAVYGNDVQAGKSAVQLNSVSSTGAGFKVTGRISSIPAAGQVSDYTPYVEQLLKSGPNGGAPDAILCVMGVQCLNVMQQMASRGYKGIMVHSLYTDILVKALAGTVAAIPSNNLSEDNPSIRTFKADLDRVQPNGSSKADLPSAYAYGAADIFIQALKAAAKKGKSNITQENVRKIASTMTWKIPAFWGPVSYPKSTVMTHPACSTVAVSDGKTWVTKVPFSCSNKTYSPNLKIG